MIKKIFGEFLPEYKMFNSRLLISGHISDTYLIESDKGLFVLQKLNHYVFPNIPGLMQNKVLVAAHLAQDKMFLHQVLRFYPAKNNLYYFYDDNGNYWNLMDHIGNSKVLNKTENAQQAHEAGKAFGHFISHLNHFDANQLIEVIPGFHKMSFRFQQFDQTLTLALPERRKMAEQWIEQVLSQREKMHQLQYLHEAGEIPLRVTHNDTKLSNILFDENDRALAVIDWDTLMPGIVHYDFGDSVRSICSTAVEDETDLNKVQFNPEFYQNYHRGFLSEVETILSATEKELLPLAAQTITFIMGLRFLTDFLNGDIYYKTKYPEHNLHRAANQLTLVNRMQSVLE